MCGVVIQTKKARTCIDQEQLTPLRPTPDSEEGTVFYVFTMFN